MNSKRLFFIFTTIFINFSLLSINSVWAKSHFFTLDKSPNIGKFQSFNSEKLCQLARNTHYYLTQHPQDIFAVHTGDVYPNNISLDQVKKTLHYICNIQQQDRQEKRSSRLNNKEFLIKNFDFYQWHPDLKTAGEIAEKSSNHRKSEILNNIPTKHILLTKYYTKLLNASENKTEMYDQALYQLPFDEQGLTIAQANQIPSLTRFKYTRQEVMSGVLDEKKLAKPLVWLTEEALHDVLLQGTGVLKINNKIRYFNVHRHNGIPYDYALGKTEQKRYWYFTQVPNIMGYGTSPKNKIPLQPKVAFAGNIKQLGLGKLFMVSYVIKDNTMSSLGILADQGGAFDDNLFQLDYLVESFYGWEDYYQQYKTWPNYAQAWLVIKKQ